MGTAEILTCIGLGITVLGGLAFLIFRSGKTFGNIETIKCDIQEIKTSIRIIPTLEDKIEVIWRGKFGVSESPVVLNDEGKRILEQSGIKETVSRNYADLLSYVKECKPQNAYRAQECIIDAVNEMAADQNCINELEAGAFKSGSTVAIILYVGAIDIRDKIIAELGFKKEDIDKDDPITTKS